MYLFSRTGRVRPGNLRESTAWAVGITEKVKQITGLNVRLWTTMLSPGNGTLRWTAFVDDLTTLDNANAKLMVDDIFVSEVDRGAQFTSGEGVNDELNQIVHGADNIDPSRDVRYATVVRSELVPGGFANGIAAGIEIAQRVTQIGGLTTLFLVSATGTYGGVSWITAAESLEELERADQAVNADLSFIQYVDEVAPGVYLPGVTTQTMYQRLV